MMTKIGLIRCEKNEAKCPLTSCLKALSSAQEGFTGYEGAELVGVFTWRCPEDGLTNLVKILKSKGAERVHFCTCLFAHKEAEGWVLGGGFCPELDEHVRQAAKESGIPCVKGSAHLPRGYVPEVFA